MDILTTVEAAARLGLSPRQVRHLAAQGRLRGARKLGRDWVFDPGFKVLKNGADVVPLVDLLNDTAEFAGTVLAQLQYLENLQQTNQEELPS